MSSPDYKDEDLQDFTPKDIAQVIFSKNPSDPCTNNMLIDQDSADPIYIFEILLTVLLEGLDIFTKNVCLNGLREADLTNFSVSNITALNPWFHSLGFVIVVDTEYVADAITCNVVDDASEESVGEENDDDDSDGDSDCSTSDNTDDGKDSKHVPVSDHYCRVVLNRDSFQSLFMINNVSNASYHFLLNGAALDDNLCKQNIQDLQAIFEANDTMYRLSFDFYRAMDRPQTLI